MNGKDASIPESAVLRLAQEQRSFGTFRTITALILREMQTTYGRSPGGYLWAILEPVGGIALLTLAFSLVFKKPPLGNSFVLFYATGVLPFTTYNVLSSKLTQSISFSKSLLAYPTVTFVDAIIARFILNFVTELAVAYVVYTGTIVLLKPEFTPELMTLAKSYAMVAVLSLGVGTMNCFLASMFPVWQRVWSILNRPAFLLSGIFFMFDSIPEPYGNYLWFNPLVHLVGATRASFYASYHADYVDALYVYGVGLTLLMLGLLFLQRYHRVILQP